MVRWVRWHCPPDTGFEIRALAVWSRARYLPVTEAPHNINSHTWMGKKHFLFLSNLRNREPSPELWRERQRCHYHRAPAQPPSCTYRLSLVSRTTWGWWDEWDDTALETQNSKYWIFTSERGRNILLLWNWNARVECEPSISDFPSRQL